MAGRSIPYSRLLADVFILRDAIRNSREDHDLKAGGVEIVYFVDPALLELYVEPAGWAPRLAAFPSLGLTSGPVQDDGTVSDETALRATALLTGEYIFSRVLVDAYGDLYVSPDHTTDLVGYIGKVEGRYREAVEALESGIEQSPEIWTALTQRLRSSQALKRAGLQTPAFLDLWRQALVGELGEIAAESLLVAKRLNDLIAQDVLANAAIREDFTDDIIAPSRKRITEWAADIRQAKQHNSRPNTPEAIQADAVTLEQLWLLNRAADRKRYVLITDDAGLHAAYIQMMSRRSEERPFYALRRPIQYTPILNLNDMGGAFQTGEVFQRIEEGIEDIAQAFSSTDDLNGTNVLAYLERNAPTTSDAATLDRNLVRMAQDVRNDWNTLVDYACSAKADVLSDHVAEQEDYWLKFISSRHFREGFTRTAKSFREEAVSLSASSSLLRHEIWAVHALGDDAVADPDTFSRRRLASNLDQFDSPSLAGISLPEVVQDWMSSGPAALEALKGVEVKGERLLCVGVLCLQIGAWGAAHRLLAEARQSLPRSESREVRHEAEFFLAVAARLTATERHWKKNISEAGTALGAIRRQEMDRFQRARLASEEIALKLSEAPWLYQANDRTALKTTVAQVENRMEEFARAHLPTLIDQREHVRNMAVIKQACLNAYCLSIWRAIITSRIETPNFLQPYHEAFGSTWMKAYATGGPHTECYPRLAILATGMGSPNERALIATEAIERIDKALKKDVDYSFAFDMPQVDKLELRQMSRWASQFR